MRIDEGMWIAPLAGLLHDVGKFAQRAGWAHGKHAMASLQLLEDGGPLSHLVPLAWRDDVEDAVVYHHGGDTHKPSTQAVRVADWLAASERTRAAQEKRSPAEVPLIPITANLSLHEQAATHADQTTAQWGYPLGKMITGKVLFPEKNAVVSSGDYGALWDAFESDVREIPGPVDSFARMSGLLDLLSETLTYMPSATPWEDLEKRRTTPDVSLYNHLQLTAAISACLMRIHPDSLDQLHRAGWRQIDQRQEPVARLFKLDISGIQAFIYRITEPTDDRGFRHTAKRLRGRSLYLALLNRAIADWLAQHLGLPPTNVLYASGGVIELLLPPDETSQAQLNDGLQMLSDGLWDAFHGDLGFVHAIAPMRPGDFADVRSVRLALEHRIAQAKGQKWRGRLDREDFFDREKIYHTCAVCGVTSQPREGMICQLCDTHKRVGERLPYAIALAHTEDHPPETSGVSIDLPAPLASRLTLVEADGQNALLTWADKTGSSLLLRGVNELSTIIQPWPEGSAPGCWSLANAAPVGKEGVYDFEQMAEWSQGARLLGVLRADVDRMGLQFSHGLHPATFSRSATLSQTAARFFGPYLNELAETLTQEWRESADDRTRKKAPDLKNIFYVLYAGGDDLFVVGPWDQMVTFALRLAEDFDAYTCGNLSLSAGLILVKPHFPVQQFARLAGEAERAAKTAGRARIQLFDRTLSWEKASELVQIAREWMEQDIPRGLIHDLGRMGRSYRETKEQRKPLFTPRLYYTLTRRLRGWTKEERQTLIKQIWGNLADITVPVSYVSLSTRKE